VAAYPGLFKNFACSFGYNRKEQFRGGQSIAGFNMFDPLFLRQAVAG
jgi:hypothetical protein